MKTRSLDALIQQAIKCDWKFKRRNGYEIPDIETPSGKIYSINDPKYSVLSEFDYQTKDETERVDRIFSLLKKNPKLIKKYEEYIISA